MAIKILIFDVYDPGENASGIVGFADTVTVMVESGDPGGDVGDFDNAMLEALKEWYDGAGVSIRKEKPGPHKPPYNSKDRLYA